jgi:exonuclease III
MQSLGMRNQMMKTWRGKRKMKIGTWNVRSIAGKEIELVGEIKKLNVKILGMTETKKKGQGIEKLQDRYVLYYSGVPKTQREKAGVGCIIHENLAELITGWNSVSERIMTVTVKLDTDQEEGTQIIVTYAPTEDALVEEKDTFFSYYKK